MSGMVYTPSVAYRAEDILEQRDLGKEEPAVTGNSLGYYDISYFTRLFKKHTDFTPRQYRSVFNKETSD